jgi:hypothetical protein
MRRLRSVREVRLNATVAGQQVNRERLGKIGNGVKQTEHLGLSDAHHGSVGH